MGDYTYIARDNDSDSDAVQHIEKMKANYDIWYKDVHKEIQADDESLYCSIKKSLKKRMDMSYRFILIVGDQTNTVTKGGCQLCQSYDSYGKYCHKGYSVDYRSFVKYECDIAKEAWLHSDMKIYVLYKSTIVNKDKCIECLKNIGHHYAMQKWIGEHRYWDDDNIKKAFE